MRNRFYIFLIIPSLLLISCSDEQSRIENIPNIEEIKPKATIVKKKPPKEYNFKFTDLNKQLQNISIKNNYYNFLDLKQPIVMINFFATWCPPCVGQIPHLNKLQKRYKDNLSVLSLLIHDDIKSEELDKFIASQKINFFVSNHINDNMKFSNFISPKLQLNPNFPLPVMILFVRGRYYTHYEGSIPEEMIESDIKQALKKIEG